MRIIRTSARRSKTAQSKVNAQESLKNPSCRFERSCARERTHMRRSNFALRIDCQLDVKMCKKLCRRSYVFVVVHGNCDPHHHDNPTPYHQNADDDVSYAHCHTPHILRTFKLTAITRAESGRTDQLSASCSLISGHPDRQAGQRVKSVFVHARMRWPDIHGESAAR